MASHLQQTTGNAEERGASEVARTRTPWGWQRFGKEFCIVGQHGMRPIVLAVRKGRLTSLVDGLLVPFNPDHPDAAFIVRACNSHDALVAVAIASVKGLNTDELSEMASAALAAVGKP